MPIRRSVRAALGVLVLCGSCAVGPEGAPTEGPGERGERVSAEEVVGDMGWIAGGWSGEMWGGVFHAHYSPPIEGRILSHSWLMRGDQEAFYEFELFEGRDGVVRMQPFPGGRKAGGFVMSEHDPAARKVTFENPDKDYPTRIVYHRVADDRLVITLDDPHGESGKVEVFELGR